MARGEVDPLDLAALPLFILGSLLSLGMMDPGTIYGVDLMAEIVTLGPETTVTFPHLMAIAALAAVFYTNKPSLDVWTLGYSWVIVATIILVLATPFMPVIEHYTSSSPMAGFVAFSVQSLGYGIASWMG